MSIFSKWVTISIWNFLYYQRVNGCVYCFNIYNMLIKNNDSLRSIIIKLPFMETTINVLNDVCFYLIAMNLNWPFSYVRVYWLFWLIFMLTKPRSFYIINFSATLWQFALMINMKTNVFEDQNNLKQSTTYILFHILTNKSYFTLH